MIKFQWVKSNEVLKIDKDLEVRQIYCWIITKDGKVVIVSKDNKSWQFPGGKPKKGENGVATIKREVAEETSYPLTIDDINNLQFFGYYKVEDDENRGPHKFLQLRYYLKIGYESTELKLHPKNEDPRQDNKDKINYVDVVSLEEAIKVIPWLRSTEEYRAILELAHSAAD